MPGPEDLVTPKWFFICYQGMAKEDSENDEQAWIEDIDRWNQERPVHGFFPWSGVPFSLTSGSQMAM